MYCSKNEAIYIVHINMIDCDAYIFRAIFTENTAHIHFQTIWVSLIYIT